MNMPDLSAWKIHSQGFPKQESFAEKMRFALQYAIRAPSIHNSQPWRFEINEDIVSMLVDRSRTLLIADSYNRELIISCGAALMNLRIALAYFGYPIEILTFPHSVNPDEIAQVRFNPQAIISSELAKLFPAITIRATDRNAFGPAYLARQLQTQLIAAAEKEGACLKLIELDTQRHQVAELIIAGDFVQFQDPSFRRELVNWVHDKRSLDGIPHYALGVQTRFDFGIPVVQLVMRIFDVSHDISAAHRELLQSSPVLACLSTSTDNAEGWLEAGQALQRVLLQAASAGFSASFLNQPIEVDALRNRLRDVLALKTHPYPQMLLRLGLGIKQER